MMDFWVPEIMKIMLLPERGLDFAFFEIFEKIEKSMQKGPPNSCFWLKNRRLDAPGGPYLAILVDF